MPKTKTKRVLLDKERLLPELKNSKQSPVACDLLIHKIEQGEFDVEVETEEA